MNIFDMNPQWMDDMATEYLNGMYESQYDDDTNDDQSDLNQHTKPIETDRKDEEIPF